MICIVGADGFFGSFMQRHILSKSSHPFLLCLNHSEAIFPEADNKADMGFELSDPESIARAAEVISSYSDVNILFLSSVHNPDAVKKDPERARYINTVCYENFLDTIKGADVTRLIYASSDTVYGESLDSHSFTELDSPSPINIYGEQKLMAEEITYRYNYQCARYSYMCAPSLISRKKHFFDELLSTLKRGEQIFMLTDWVRSSLSYSTAAELSYRLLLSDFTEKAVNICADSPTSKYDIGLMAAQHINAPSSLVVPCTSEELGIFSERRARDIITDNSLLKKLLSIDEIKLQF